MSNTRTEIPLEQRKLLKATDVCRLLKQMGKPKAPSTIRAIANRADLHIGLAPRSSKNPSDAWFFTQEDVKRIANLPGPGRPALDPSHIGIRAMRAKNRADRLARETQNEEAQPA